MSRLRGGRLSGPCCAVRLPRGEGRSAAQCASLQEEVRRFFSVVQRVHGVQLPLHRSPPARRRVAALSCAGGVQSEEVAKLNTGKDAGYRLAMHPSGRALVRRRAARRALRAWPALRWVPHHFMIPACALPCCHAHLVGRQCGCIKAAWARWLAAQVCGMSIGGLERVDLQPSTQGGGEPPKLSLSQGAPTVVVGPRCRGVKEGG